MHLKNLSHAACVCLFPITGLLGGCGSDADNQKPIFGSETGLPANCRAYVQFAVDEFRGKKYTADETMIGLERNCGANGSLWK